MLNQNDLRVIKTRRNIEQSLIRLLGEKSFDKITVQDILNVALINRSTFYKHYIDKYDLAAHLCESYFTAFKDDVNSRFNHDGTKLAIQSVEHLYQFFYANKEPILRLFSVRTECIHLYDDMFSYLKECFFNQYKNMLVDTDRLDYLSTLYASLCITSIKWSLENGDYLQLTDMFSVFQSCFSVLQETFDSKNSSFY